MIRQGWEFVQAYTSGEDGCYAHMVLRIDTSKLDEKQKQDFEGQRAKLEERR